LSYHVPVSNEWNLDPCTHVCIEERHYCPKLHCRDFIFSIIVKNAFEHCIPKLLCKLLSVMHVLYYFFVVSVFLFTYDNSKSEILLKFVNIFFFLVKAR
jgi:hypothetical protein